MNRRKQRLVPGWRGAAGSSRGDQSRARAQHKHLLKHSPASSQNVSYVSVSFSSNLYYNIY